ncbi:subtilase-type protease inhibitor [Streptomyces verrucosisporus]|uniref:subtilase-type protease inhibitor n=1 Tax=Streptomyces verrucosisporus TaxID=1695161 RepID=UPI0019CFFD9B|nr:subtilase-type protease inhibitor [Streptomyces verrucosisporus]MBN3928236.1 subtilase-type protease inhibitor [Streptomyces verrucosisporus]
MRYATKGLGLGAVLTAACLAGSAAAATAAPTTAPASAAADRPSGPSVLALTVAAGENPATAPERRSATLVCPPGPGGAHPAPERACAALRSVDGEVGALVETDTDRVCPMIWDPVTITAKGVWGGRAVSYERTFANSCVMEGATGPVFSF